MTGARRRERRMGSRRMTGARRQGMHMESRRTTGARRRGMGTGTRLPRRMASARYRRRAVITRGSLRRSMAGARRLHRLADTITPRRRRRRSSALRRQGALRRSGREAMDAARPLRGTTRSRRLGSRTMGGAEMTTGADTPRGSIGDRWDGASRAPVRDGWGSRRRWLRGIGSGLAFWCLIFIFIFLLFLERRR
jgi:hypothetical protein